MKYFFDTEFLEGPQNKRFLGIAYGKTKPTIDLISIAIVSEKGDELYLISKEFNLYEAWNRYQLDYGHGDARNAPPRRIYWLRKNVLEPIFNHLIELDYEYCEKAYSRLTYPVPISNFFNYTNLKAALKRHGKKNVDIRKEINAFICPLNIAGLHPAGLDQGFREHIQQDPPEFYAYYADYDWVVFCWIYGLMIDLPKGFPFYCRDLKQMLDDKAAALHWYYGRDVWSNTRKPDERDLQKADRLATTDEKVEKVKTHPDFPNQNSEHDALDDARFNRNLYNFLLNKFPKDEEGGTW